ncbi:MAG: hypothetical protein RMZ42_31335 [Nostoc sp. DedQUE05]|nr:hypothetical protein [Nostoc sp. DedQUE05]MDZ8096396.1 hypothetical protein [Nostoc sp. DedQUE05]
MTDQKTEGQRLEDLMTKIDTEMQRLGWTVEQGREHLQKYYGKRSR